MWFFGEKKYLSWGEFSNKTLELEYLDFLTKSVEDAADNSWDKEERR